MQRTILFFASVVIGLNVLAPAAISAEPAHRQLTAVPFTAVKVQDVFWAPRLQVNREKSLPHNFKWCEQTGRFSNFAKAAGLSEGQVRGHLLQRLRRLQGSRGSVLLAGRSSRSRAGQMTVDKVIAKIAAAQQKDGYLNTYYTLVEPGKRWTRMWREARVVLCGPSVRGRRRPLSERPASGRSWTWP